MIMRPRLHDRLLLHETETGIRVKEKESER